MHDRIYSNHPCNVIIMMGVSGSGKSTIGAGLADALGWRFLEGDHVHPKANIVKMSAGNALTDEDRRPWLAELHKIMKAYIESNQYLVLSCSALKKTYRTHLTEKIEEKVQIVVLKSSCHLIRKRLLLRQGHYMKAELLDSQFADLEYPENDEKALYIDVVQPPDVIIRELCQMISVQNQ